jgi:hypothetical protein
VGSGATVTLYTYSDYAEEVTLRKKERKENKEKGITKEREKEREREISTGLKKHNRTQTKIKTQTAGKGYRYYASWRPDGQLYFYLYTVYV